MIQLSVAGYHEITNKPQQTTTPTVQFYTPPTEMLSIMVAISPYYHLVNPASADSHDWRDKH